MEDLLDRYDADPRELNVSPVELRSEREIDCDAIMGCADRGDGKPVGDICCAVGETAFVSCSGAVLLGWLKLSALAGSGEPGAVAVGGGEGRGLVG